jgi:hypothetical protein
VGRKAEGEVAEANETWAAGLSAAIARTLDEFRGRLAERVALLAVDCHPGDGTLDLSLLTYREVERNALLSDPAEMAAWEFFHFGGDLASWQPARALAQQMRERYGRAGECRAAVAEGYLRACAVALASEVVREAVARYDLADGFRLSVPHPDSDTDFYTAR